jgi:hypothetical protein
MLLRRVIEHVRKQEWTAIGIDFVIVVVGVFVGIQVSNWNEARADDARAQAYLARIRVNLQADLLSIKRRETFWRQVIAYGKGAIRYAETGELVEGSAWKTVLAFYQASQLWQWVTSDSTYQEMRSAGELGLIRDQGLRDRLSQYYLENGTGTAYLFMLQPEYRKLVRGLTPSVVADHIWANCWQQPAPSEQYLLDCDAPISEVQAHAVLDGYLEDPQVLKELRFWVANQGVALGAIGNYNPLLKDMLARGKPEPAR